MIYSTTYQHKEYKNACNMHLGVGYSLIQRIKTGGVKSKKMVVAKLSKNLKPNQDKYSDTLYGYIELRPKGIIVHHVQLLDRTSWIIPFYKLAIYNTDFYSIHAGGYSIYFEKNKKYKDNTKFVKRLITQRKIFLEKNGFEDVFRKS